MYLDKRSKNILEDLISHPNMSSKDIESKTGLTRRQIKYSVEKINSWLKVNNYPTISRLKNGKFIIQPVLAELHANDKLRIAKNYILSEEERVLLILFILLAQDDLSLIHFTQALKVSNVTILSDMKEAKQRVKDFGLEIIYSRTEGYQLFGEEWIQRNLLYYILNELSDRYAGLALIQDFAMLDEKKLDFIFLQLEKIEEFLGIKFTDEKLQLSPYCIGIILERVNRGNIITFDFQIQYKELSDTKEYEATEHLIKYEKNLPEVERLYITLQLLATNIFSGEVLSENGLKNALIETIQLFEKNAFIELRNKDYLVNRLMLHLKPAYYRIKYNLTSFHDTVVQLDKAYVELDYIVGISLGPLETYINSEIPTNERFYITLFIGGHLIETKQSLVERKKAIVICRNGVTVSKLLRNTLTKLFPEFYFYETMSVREFYERNPNDIEIVFSPEPIKSNANVFIINVFLSEKDQALLRQRVMKWMYGFKSETLDLQRLLSIIEKSADIHSTEKLKAAIQEFFYPSKSEPFIEAQQDRNPDLNQLINENTIQMIDTVSDWKTGIRFAAKPLIDNHSITKDYVETMIMSHDFNHPYMILGKSMAIPHASPEHGVNKLSMSLLVVKNGVLFSKDHNINFIVIIAPTDATQHVKAIYQLSKLAENELTLQKLLVANSSSSIVETIEDFQLVIQDKKEGSL
ncbi:BglG family transcription antiterminator [Mesobacillus stamsii]|uniref:Ascorbate-specific PTS system EIIA component n=1 Tax=Mesobacillus stamsii TaxID=225347 RepID=A0ABU0G097_9BACI|nr:BglG family transcription antiterminator [Mesobacillus stamsii]MDQ0415611.1 transcriptional antiterminator/mannitol/fructose-specific phosphotransferase system IIA component (Ntr-type) [Mesobacillus stamsii]